ncbi:MAG: IS5 family transposase [Acidimicrobiales bacterium]|nr:IS5 family transposase [Acidimicrobiales bacterium]
MESEPVSLAQTWRSTQGDMSDAEWELIADLVAPYWSPGKMGRPVEVERRRIVDAVFYVAATGCQWRALPLEYPKWSTVHSYHLRWSRDGTWERIAQRLVAAVREAEGRQPGPSAGVVDARSVRGAATVTGGTRGYDAGKKISGRKTFGIVDTSGLLIAIWVVAASTSDNTGGIAVADLARARSKRFAKLWCDGGFKRTFIDHCRHHHVAVEVVSKIHPGRFEVLPRRWVVERTWSWIMNHRRLQVDYERDPVVHEGFIWAAHSRMLLRRLTEPAPG